MQYISSKYIVYSALFLVIYNMFVCLKRIETCTDIDLTMSCIESNEYELQDLHYGFEKALEKFTNKEVYYIFLIKELVKNILNYCMDDCFKIMTLFSPFQYPFNL